MKPFQRPITAGKGISSVFSETDYFGKGNLLHTVRLITAGKGISSGLLVICLLRKGISVRRVEDCLSMKGNLRCLGETD